MSTQLPPAVASQNLDTIIGRMLGDIPTFVREHWHRKPLLVRRADPDRLLGYGVEEFLADLVSTQPAPYGAVRIRDGKRFDSFHATPEALRDEVGDGSVCAIKMSRAWHDTMPASWTSMRGLYGSLCRAAAPLYMGPRRSEDVDLFLAGPDSCLGTHFDTTDVFTVQLSGERRWFVEEAFSLEGILEVGRDPGWYPTREIDFPGHAREIVLCAGDALYVPAYTVHRVVGISWAVSLSLGLRAFNEIDVVEHLLESLRRSHYMRYPPFAGAPESLEAEHAQARVELMQRVRALLGQLEGLALGYLMSPMELPSVYDLPRPDDRR